jgi:hypothetical protein
MGKNRITTVTIKKNADGTKINKKSTSHSSYRCKRKPTSPYCQPMHPNS